MTEIGNFFWKVIEWFSTTMLEKDQLKVALVSFNVAIIRDQAGIIITKIRRDGPFSPLQCFMIASVDLSLSEVVLFH